MKKVFTLFCMVAALWTLKAQPVITEIMYNPPESGADSLEYIEIYNGTGASIDMTGWTLSTAVTFTFPSFVLNDAAHVIVAGNDTAFMNVFGIPAFQWLSSTALNNTGEAIELKNANGDLMDVVAYSNGNGWPSTANGQGSSLELCNYLAENNDPSVWVASMNGTGIFINGFEIKASPGEFNNVVCPEDLVYPQYSIGEVTTTNAAGEADSTGALAELTGVVYGVNLRPTGLQFYLIDAQNNGINVFYNTGNFGYTVQEGDLITVQGTIGQFNGLIQISPDTVWFVDDNQTLFPPTIVTELNESTESQLVRINNLTLVDPGEWLTGQGTGFSVQVTDGSNIYIMRIDNDVDLFNTAAPVGTFDAIGIGTQFDASVPLDSGYSFIPRYIADIIYSGNVLIVNNDVAITDIDTEVVIDVDNNDFYPNTIMEFIIFQDPAFGTAVITNAADFEITYTPNPGYCGPDLFLYQICDTDGCEEGTVNITVSCGSSVPMYDIGQINGEDANGVADSLGVVAQVVGTVYGYNLRPAGLQFTIIDDNGEGIGIFSSSDNLGYTVNEGDLVIVEGTVAQFNGFTQMEATLVELVISDYPLASAQVVNQLDESTESQLVKLNNVTLVDAGQWTNTGSGFNVDVTDGTNTYQVRIDADTDIFGTPAPTGPFNVTGLGGQFDSSDPFTSGYQLVPRYLEDIDLINGIPELGDPSLVEIAPNPASTETMVHSSLIPDKIEVMTMTGRKVMEIQTPSQMQALSVRDLPSGIYTIRCFFNNVLVNKQLVKM